MVEVPCSEIEWLIRRLDKLTGRILEEAKAEMKVRDSLWMAGEILGAAKVIRDIYCERK